MIFTAPHIEYALLSPILIILGAAVIGILVEAALPRPRRFVVQVAVAAIGVLGSLAAAIYVLTRINADSGSVAAMESLALDGPAIIGWLIILVFGVLGVLLFAERSIESGVTAFAGQAASVPGTDSERLASAKGMEHTEVFPLLGFALAGMMILLTANDLITMFVALEVLSLPLYLLSGLARRRRLLSQEAALKYFMLGAFSSGFLVYGIALTYGFAGSMQYSHIAEAIAAGGGTRAFLLGGMALTAVALLFKVGAVPFHAWTPDVYQGAPTPVTAFMAAATKAAAFIALLRLFYVAFGGARADWLPFMWVIAILTMVVGSVVALAQTDVKRLLAYSSVAHAGFILTGLLGARALGEIPEGTINPVQAVIFYVITYGFMTLAAFALVTVVRDSSGEATDLDRWKGLGKESPLVAGIMAFLLLGMAGIPLTSGFTGKWAVFAAALSGGAWPVVIIAVLMSAVAVYFYLKVIVAMFFADPVGEGPTVAIPGLTTTTVIAVGVAVTLALGVVPGPLLSALGNLSEFIR